MTDQDRPQIYLITPQEFELSSFPAVLSNILDNFEIACIRLALSTQDEDRIAKSADQIRTVAHSRDIPVLLERHYRMVERLGLDGVHLSDGSRSVRAIKKEMPEETVLGTYCGASRHDGMTAGEIGADYIAFGPMQDTGLGDGTIAEFETFEWWSEMIELPVVAEGALSRDVIETFAPVTDFFAIGPEIWRADDPLTELRALTAPLGA